MVLDSRWGNLSNKLIVIALNLCWNFVSVLYFGHFWPTSLNLYGRSGFGIVDGWISSNELRVIALDVCCFHAQSWTFFSPFLFQLCILVDIRQELFGIVYGGWISSNKQLLPLIYVENWCLCSILGIFWLILFKLCIWVDIWVAKFAIIYRSVMSNKLRDIALYLEIDFGTLSWPIISSIFFKLWMRVI